MAAFKLHHHINLKSLNVTCRELRVENDNRCLLILIDAKIRRPLLDQVVSTEQERAAWPVMPSGPAERRTTAMVKDGIQLARLKVTDNSGHLGL